MKQILMLALIVFLLSCNRSTNTGAEAHTLPLEGGRDCAEVTINSQIFWDNLVLHCGKAFEGRVVKAPSNDDFSGKRLVMHIRSCSDSLILVPFNVGENRSRTLVFSMKDYRIGLKHDHRHEDGSSDLVTMYGGTALNYGLANMQVFPADQETADLIPAATGNVWWVCLTDSVFTYNLKRLGTDREFSLVFDLTSPVEIPEASWGWE